MISYVPSMNGEVLSFKKGGNKMGTVSMGPIKLNNSKRKMESPETLMKIIDVMESNMTDDEKALELVKAYNNSGQFRTFNSQFLKDNNEDEIVNTFNKKIADILEKFREYEETGLVDNVRYIHYVEEVLKNRKFGHFEGHNSLKEMYIYAEKYVLEYINSDKSYLITDFLQSVGIKNEETFDVYVNTIKLLNYHLYQKYLQKKERNIQKRYFMIIYSLKTMARAIEDGHMPDGRPFDLLEFYKLEPFKNCKNFRGEMHEIIKINPKVDKKIIGVRNARRIDLFTEAVLPNENKIIMEYIRQKNINLEYKYLTENDLKTQYLNITQSMTDENGETVMLEFTSLDLDNIIKFMSDNSLPIANPIFNIVKNKYFHGELDEYFKEDTKHL